MRHKEIRESNGIKIKKRDIMDTEGGRLCKGRSERKVGCQGRKEKGVGCCGGKERGMKYKG